MTIDPMVRLDAGRAAAKAGRYAEALAEYQWFHEESLAIEPAVYGVRLSYALSDWAKLGESYPEYVELHRTVMSHTERRAESDELREFALSLVEDDSIREKTRLLLS